MAAFSDPSFSTRIVLDAAKVWALLDGLEYGLRPLVHTVSQAAELASVLAATRPRSVTERAAAGASGHDAFDAIERLEVAPQCCDRLGVHAVRGRPGMCQ
eukprot:3861263-Prymnesium_polylepis.3